MSKYSETPYLRFLSEAVDLNIKLRKISNGGILPLI
jgi:hypothetical protein